jgi:cubilin
LITVTNNCANTMVIEEESYIISPNYPQPYGHSMDCTWTLKSKAGSYIKLKNIDFDVEGFTGYDCNEYDDVRIYNLGNGQEKIIGSYCNKNTPFKGLLSTGNELKMHFTSNDNNYYAITYTGFKFEYSLVKPGTYSSRAVCFQLCKIF